MIIWADSKWTDVQAVLYCDDDVAQLQKTTEFLTGADAFRVILFDDPSVSGW